MKIVVVGHTGFVGRAVYKYLKEKRYVVEGLNSNSPYENRECDIVINCAGNSKKYFVDKNYTAARLIEDKIFSRLQKIKTEKIIHISSIDIKEHNNYGLLKRYSEGKIKKLFPNFCILRLGGLVGEGLSKNVVYDLLNDYPLWITSNSILNFIHVSTVAELIGHLIENWKSQEIINVAANRSVSIRKIANIMNKIPLIHKDAKTECHQINSRKLQAFFKIEDSEYYVRKYYAEQHGGLG